MNWHKWETQAQKWELNEISWPQWVLKETYECLITAKATICSEKWSKQTKTQEIVEECDAVLGRIVRKEYGYAFVEISIATFERKNTAHLWIE